VVPLNRELEDELNFDLDEAIEKIKYDDQFLTYMIANMAGIVEHSDDAIIGIDCEGTILSWNNGAGKMYGYSSEEAIGKLISIVIPQDHQEDLKFILENVNNSLVNKSETIRKAKDGKKIDVSITISPVKDSKNNICGASIIERDITKQKQVEESLRRSEEKYRRLFDDDLTGDFIATLNGKILDCNHSFAEIYGLKSTEQAKTFNISDFNPDDWSYLVKNLKTKKKIPGHQTMHIRPDGKEIHVVTNVVGIFNELNQLVQIKGYIFDDTERKEAEESLRRSEEKYRRLFDDDLTGDFIATLNGKILDCNKSFAEIYGFKSTEQAKTFNISDFNPDDWSYLLKNLKIEQKIPRHQTVHQRPDGKEIHIVANFVGIFNELDQLVQIKGYIFDETGRKELEEDLERNERKYRRLFDEDFKN
jgi:PAS domain S-box-containing protein